jgi:hypothetical protein
MPIVAIVEFPPQADLDMQTEYRRIAEEVNGGPFRTLSDWGGGMIAHAAAARDDGGGLIVDVWEDEASMEAWMQRIRPHLEGGPDPQVRVLPAFNVVTGAPVRA